MERRSLPNRRPKKGIRAFPAEASAALSTMSLPVAKSGGFEARGPITALINTMSSDARFFSRHGETVTSSRRVSHLSGSIAATVNKPSAGRVARWPTNLKMCLKLQNRSGSSG